MHYNTVVGVRVTVVTMQGVVDTARAQHDTTRIFWALTQLVYRWLITPKLSLFWSQYYNQDTIKLGPKRD